MVTRASGQAKGNLDVNPFFPRIYRLTLERNLIFM